MYLVQVKWRALYIYTHGELVFIGPSTLRGGTSQFGESVLFLFGYFVFFYFFFFIFPPPLGQTSEEGY